jgi:hypothetical protein
MAQRAPVPEGALLLSSVAVPGRAQGLVKKPDQSVDIPCIRNSELVLIAIPKMINIRLHALGLALQLHFSFCMSALGHGLVGAPPA